MPFGTSQRKYTPAEIALAIDGTGIQDWNTFETAKAEDYFSYSTSTTGYSRPAEILSDVYIFTLTLPQKSNDKSTLQSLIRLRAPFKMGFSAPTSDLDSFVAEDCYVMTEANATRGREEVDCVYVIMCLSGDLEQGGAIKNAI